MKHDELSVLLTPRDAALYLASLRKTRGGGSNGGRPRKPAKCRRCGTPCASTVEAINHCRVARKAKA